nr:MarR family transcriptional regulator [Kribbella sandramycini]
MAKLFADDRRRVLADLNIDPATLDLLSVLRRAGAPYQLTTRELAARTLVTAGAISQRVTRAESANLVTRTPAPHRAVLITLTPTGHALIERSVDQVLTRESALISSLTPESRAHLATALQSLLNDVTHQTSNQP